jgi:anti-sigma B factor antagonist
MVCLLGNGSPMYSRKEMGPTDTNTRGKEGVVIIALPGGIDTNAPPQPEKESATQMEDGKRNIHLNFSNVKFIRSCGLRVLISTSNKIAGPLIKSGFCGLSQGVNKILKLDGFTTMFTIFPSEGDTFDAWK